MISRRFRYSLAIVIGGFPITNNRMTGLLLVNANGDRCIDIGADNNGHDGIHLMQTGGVCINSSSASSNGAFGIWIDGSRRTVLDKVTASANGSIDIKLNVNGASASKANTLENVVAKGAPRRGGDRSRQPQQPDYRDRGGRRPAQHDRRRGGQESELWD